jgi:uncharacterized damage-inducible protein DinB
MIATASSMPRGQAGSCAERPQATLMRLLDELEGVLNRLSPSIYTAQPFPAVSGSIGQHVRHILDHIGSVCAAAPPSPLCYDDRVRGTNVEADIDAALRQIRRLTAALPALPSGDDLWMTMTSALVPGGEPVAVGTTLGRELLFVISHTIHHQALIGLLLSAAGGLVPQGFGLAPSTPRFARA